jgi:hypothetical protein
MVIAMNEFGMMLNCKNKAKISENNNLFMMKGAGPQPLEGNVAQSSQLQERCLRYSCN